MSDFNSVAQSQVNFNQSSAFAAALQRAKQIAAKIHPGTNAGAKRPHDDSDSYSEPDNKKFNPGEYGSPPSNMSPTSRQASAQVEDAQAAAVAARLAQNGTGNTVNEELKLNEKLVSIVTNRNDDQLGRIQMEAGCKVYMSRESDRVCILNGTRDSVNRAKDLLQGLSNQYGCGPLETVSCVVIPPSNSTGYPGYQEIMVPGSKVGLVIGKGGETIKMLQEKTGAKMVIIQDGPGQELEKPLRISGDPQKVEHAKQMVFDLILDKDAYNNRTFSNSGGGGGGGTETTELFVPKSAVGVVIGKGGDMIKKIQNETGCKLQFIQGKGDGPGDRRCIISGTSQQVEDAKRTIEELIENVSNRGQGMNRGNQNQGNGGAMAPGSNYGYGGDAGGPQQMREEVSFTVPAAKCGIVIGRGGETIKLINQQSGAFCEMDRAAINPPNEKMFKMKGSQEQIERARQLISDKIGVDIKILSSRSIGGSNNGQQNNGFSGNMQGNANYGQQWPGYQGQSWDMNQQQNNMQQAAGGGQADYSQQWIEYYKQMGMHAEAEMIEQQLKAKQTGGGGDAMGGAAMPMPNAVQNAQTSQMMAAAGAASAAGQHDYSAQWAAYYRNLGKIEEAEAIENQIKNRQPNTGTPTSTPSGFPAVGQAMANYNAQMAQYYGSAQQQQYTQAAYGQAYGNYPGQPPQQPQTQQQTGQGGANSAPPANGQNDKN